MKHHKDEIDGEDENDFLHRDDNHLHENEDVDKDGDLHEHEHGVSRRPLQPHKHFRELCLHEIFFMGMRLRIFTMMGIIIFTPNFSKNRLTPS